MNKPNWNDAPEWASYYAENEDGTRHWYENEPLKCYAGWGLGVGYGRTERICLQKHDWSDSLQERPK